MSRLQRNVLRDREQAARAAQATAYTTPVPVSTGDTTTDTTTTTTTTEPDPEDSDSGSVSVPVSTPVDDSTRPTLLLDDIRTIIREVVTDVLRTNQSAQTQFSAPAPAPAPASGTPYPTYASVVGKPALSLTTEEMVEIRNILNGTFISTSRELISALHRMSKIRLVSDDDSAEFCTVSLPEDVLTRIYSRMPPDTTIEEFVSEKITDWTGMFVDGGL